MSKELILEGEKLLLRRISLADADATYLSWLNDDEVTRGLETIVKPYTAEMLQRYVKEIVANENIYMFMVVDKESGKAIGTTKLHNISKKNGTCNIGLMIGDKNFWGKGYGGDIYRTIVRFAFEELHIRKIWEMVHSDNEASLGMFRKMGFGEEGRLKEQVLSDGKFVDNVLLGLFAKDWKK